MALASGDNNEIVIGYGATGAGSNSAVLGNSSITKTILQGNVGIGTTTPGGTLSVVSSNTTGTTTSSAFNLSANSLTTGTGLYAASSTLTSGYLVDLQVSGTAAAASQKALNILTTGANANAGITTYGAYISNTHSGTTSVDYGLYVNASSGATNYGLIVDGGNVGIGTTTPGSKLTVVGTLTSSGGDINLNASSNYAVNIGTGTTNVGIAIGNTNNTTTFAGPVTMSNATITLSGLASNTGTYLCLNGTTVVKDSASACTTGSSIRWKQNVQTMGDALAVLNELRPVTFNWIPGMTAANGGQYDFGFIAEEVNNIFPNLISTDSDGQISGLSYTGLIPIVTRAVQEQQQQITNIQSDIVALKNSTQNGVLSVNGATIQGDASIDGSLNVTGPTTLANLTVDGNATFNGNVTVVGNLSVATITIDGHIITGGNTPTVTAGTAAGTDAFTQVLGNDISGTLTITTGKQVSSGTLIEVDFAKAFDKNPKVLLTPGNADTTNLKFYRDATTDKFYIQLAQPPVEGTTYTFDYMAVE
jgi:hypothetical protein